MSENGQNFETTNKVEGNQMSENEPKNDETNQVEGHDELNFVSEPFITEDENKDANVNKSYDEENMDAIANEGNDEASESEEDEEKDRKELIWDDNPNAIKIAQYVAIKNRDFVLEIVKNQIDILVLHELFLGTPDILSDNYDRVAVEVSEPQPGCSLALRKEGRLSVVTAHKRRWWCAVTLLDSLTEKKFHFVIFRGVGPAETLCNQFQDIVDHIALIQFTEPELGVILLTGMGGLIPRDIATRYTKLESALVEQLVKHLDLRSIDIPALDVETRHPLIGEPRVLVHKDFDTDIKIAGFKFNGNLLNLSVVLGDYKAETEMTMQRAADTKRMFRESIFNLQASPIVSRARDADQLPKLTSHTFPEMRKAWKNWKQFRNILQDRSSPETLSKAAINADEVKLNLSVWNTDESAPETRLSEKQVQLAAVIGTNFPAEFNSEDYERIIAEIDLTSQDGPVAAMYVDKKRFTIKETFRVSGSIAGVNVVDLMGSGTHCIHAISFTLDDNAEKAKELFLQLFKHVIRIKTHYPDMLVMLMGALNGVYQDDAPGASTGRPGYQRLENLANARGCMRKMYCVLESYLGLKTLYFRPVDEEAKTVIAVLGVETFSPLVTMEMAERSFVLGQMVVLLPKNPSKLPFAMESQIIEEFEKTLNTASEDGELRDFIRPLSSLMLYKTRNQKDGFKEPDISSCSAKLTRDFDNITQKNMRHHEMELNSEPGGFPPWGTGSAKKRQFDDGQRSDRFFKLAKYDAARYKIDRRPGVKLEEKDRDDKNEKGWGMRSDGDIDLDSPRGRERGPPRGWGGPGRRRPGDWGGPDRWGHPSDWDMPDDWRGPRGRRSGDWDGPPGRMPGDWNGPPGRMPGDWNGPPGRMPGDWNGPPGRMPGDWNGPPRRMPEDWDGPPRRMPEDWDGPPGGMPGNWNGPPVGMQGNWNRPGGMQGNWNGPGGMPGNWNGPPRGMPGNWNGPSGRPGDWDEPPGRMPDGDGPRGKMQAGWDGPEDRGADDWGGTNKRRLSKRMSGGEEDGDGHGQRWNENLDNSRGNHWRSSKGEWEEEVEGRRTGKRGYPDDSRRGDRSQERGYLPGLMDLNVGGPSDPYPVRNFGKYDDSEIGPGQVQSMYPNQVGSYQSKPSDVSGYSNMPGSKHENINNGSSQNMRNNETTTNWPQNQNSPTAQSRHSDRKGDSNWTHANAKTYEYPDANQSANEFANQRGYYNASANQTNFEKASGTVSQPEKKSKSLVSPLYSHQRNSSQLKNDSLAANSMYSNTTKTPFPQQQPPQPRAADASSAKRTQQNTADPATAYAAGSQASQNSWSQFSQQWQSYYQQGGGQPGWQGSASDWTKWMNDNGISQQQMQYMWSQWSQQAPQAYSWDQSWKQAVQQQQTSAALQPPQQQAPQQLSQEQQTLAEQAKKWKQQQEAAKTTQPSWQGSAAEWTKWMNDNGISQQQMQQLWSQWTGAAQAQAGTSK